MGQIDSLIPNNHTTIFIYLFKRNRNVMMLLIKKKRKEKNKYLPMSFLKFIESARIINRGIPPNPPPKLGEIDKISAYAARIGQYSSYKPNNRQCTDDFIGETGEGVRVLHVSPDEKNSSIGGAGSFASVGFSVEFAQVQY